MNYEKNSNTEQELQNISRTIAHEHYRNRKLMLKIEIAKATDPQVKAELTRLLEQEEKKRLIMTVLSAIIGVLVLAGLFFWFFYGNKEPERPLAEVSNSSTTDESSMTSESSSESYAVIVDSSTADSQVTRDSTASVGRTATVSVRRYSEEEKQVITTAFLDWAGNRAAMGGMAVNPLYFDHGAAGRGDWYAVTPDGLVQTQQSVENTPGYDAFPIHSLGGIVFYYSLFGTTGETREIMEHNYSMAAGYSQVADPSKPIVKYMLGDNGVVYELKSNLAYSYGFYEAGDDGSLYSESSKESQRSFVVSEDKAAQIELRRILASYN